MLWHFVKGATPDQVTPAIVLAYTHGIGMSGNPPPPVTIGARIACVSSYFHFLIRMALVTPNPCKLIERSMEHDPMGGTDESCRPLCLSTPAPQPARKIL